jgi:hypothetical protein
MCICICYYIEYIQQGAGLRRKSDSLGFMTPLTKDAANAQMCEIFSQASRVINNGSQ